MFKVCFVFYDCVWVDVGVGFYFDVVVDFCFFVDVDWFLNFNVVWNFSVFFDGNVVVVFGYFVYGYLVGVEEVVGCFEIDLVGIFGYFVGVNFVFGYEFW